MKIIVCIFFILATFLFSTSLSQSTRKVDIENKIKQSEDNVKKTISVSVPNQPKKRGSLGIHKDASPNSNSKRSTRKSIPVVQSEQDAINQLEAGDNTQYFASFDATALSTSWVQIGEEDRKNQLEREKKVQSLGYEPTPTVSYARVGDVSSSTPLSSSVENHDEHDHSEEDAHVLRELPHFTSEEIQSAKDVSTRFLESQHTWQELTTETAASHLRQGLPLVMLLLSDTPMDIHISKALKRVNKMVRKRTWQRIFNFVYVTKQTQTAFALGQMFMLDQHLIDIGENIACQEIKTVHYTFPEPFSVTPSDLVVVLHEECCGDNLHLSIRDLTAHGFTLDVTRKDEGEFCWGQHLRARWYSKEKILSHPNGVPALLLDNVPVGIHHEKYRLDLAQFNLLETDSDSLAHTAHHIVAFLEQFLMGGLELVVRSQPIPTRPILPLVEEVVGLNFKEVVLDSSKDVLLFLFGPNPYSHMLFPVLHSVANKLRDVSSVKVVAMNKMGNDIPLNGVKVTHVPALILFPGGSHEDDTYETYDFSDYNGVKKAMSRVIIINGVNPLTPQHDHYSLETVLKFMFDHVRFQDSWGETLRKEIEGYQTPTYSHQHDHEEDHN